MARLSLKVTYAIRGAMELAFHFGGAPLQAKVIAQRQAVPYRFIEQILHTMKQAGLLVSHRGAQGGYSLARPPWDISLADIVQAVNGIQDHEPSATPWSPNGHGNEQNGMAVVLSEIQQQLKNAEQAILQSITLQTLVDRYRQHEPVGALMFHI